MPDILACPNREKLLKLVLGSLAPTDGAALQEHLVRCSPCFQAVQRIKAAAGDTATTPLTSEGASGVLWLSGAPQDKVDFKADTIQARAGASPSTAKPSPYSFLAPAQQPDELGR